MYEDQREQLINTCGKEPPDPELIKKVKEAIGFPPHAVVYNMLINKLPAGTDEDELNRCLDLLHANGDIGITNNWIHGIKKIDTSKWTKDDWDWIYGTGRFAQ